MPRVVVDWQGQKYLLGTPPGHLHPQKQQTAVLELSFILSGARRVTSQGPHGVRPFLRRGEVTGVACRGPCPSCALNAINPSVQAALTEGTGLRGVVMETGAQMVPQWLQR